MAEIVVMMAVIIMAVWLMRESGDSHEIVRRTLSCPASAHPQCSPHTYPDPNHDTQPLSKLASILKMSL